MEEDGKHDDLRKISDENLELLRTTPINSRALRKWKKECEFVLSYTHCLKGGPSMLVRMPTKKTALEQAIRKQENWRSENSQIKNRHRYAKHTRKMENTDVEFFENNPEKIPDKRKAKHAKFPTIPVENPYDKIVEALKAKQLLEDSKVEKEFVEPS